MPRYCGNCGSKVDLYSGLCPNCSNRKGSPNSYVYKEKMKFKSNSGFKIFTAIVILLSIYIFLNYYGIINFPFIESNEYNEYSESRNEAIIDDADKDDLSNQKENQESKEGFNEVLSDGLDDKTEGLKNEESELRELLRQKTKKEVLAFYYDDFDSDGTKEAYAIVGNNGADEKGASLDGVDIFFIKSNKILLVKENMKSGKTKNVIDFGKYKLVCFEVSGSNSTSLSYIFGARNGKPQEMNLSGKYGEFEQDDITGMVTGYTNEFNDAHKRQYYEFEFDEDNFKIIEERKRVLR